MIKLDIKLGYACEKQCKLCVQGDLRERHPEPLSADKLIEALKEGRKSSRYVVFTGGEPTLYPHLPKLVRFARLLGFDRVQIQTNGRRFAEEAFCWELLKAGANEFAVAVHGATPATHDFLTDVPGSFERVMRGIRNLKRLGGRVMTNSVVTTKNMAELPALARLLVAVPVDHVQFAFIHICGEAWRNRDWLVPRKRDAVPFIHQALDVARAAGLRSFTEAIPYCLMKGYEECVAERVMPVMKVHHADGSVIEDFTQERMDTQKLKGPRCPECDYFRVCEGPWKEYPEMFGFDEFVPVRGGKAC